MGVIIPTRASAKEAGVGGMGMQKKISAMKARQNFGQVMNEAALRGDEFIVERAGKPMVAIVSMDKYQMLQRNRDELRLAADSIRNSMRDEDAALLEDAVVEAISAVRSGSKA